MSSTFLPCVDNLLCLNTHLSWATENACGSIVAPGILRILFPFARTTRRVFSHARTQQGETPLSEPVLSLALTHTQPWYDAVLFSRSHSLAHSRVVRCRSVLFVRVFFFSRIRFPRARRWMLTLLPASDGGLDAAARAFLDRGNLTTQAQRRMLVRICSDPTSDNCRNPFRYTDVFLS